MLRARFAYETGKIRYIFIFLIIIDLVCIGPMFLIDEPGFGWVILYMIVLLGTITFLFGFTPLLTKHEVHDTFIVIRQGWYYRNRIDYSDMRSIKHVKNGPFGLGVHFIGNRTTYVNGRDKDLILLELDEVRHINGKKRRMVRVLFDTADNDGFMRCIGRDYDQLVDDY